MDFTRVATAALAPLALGCAGETLPSPALVTRMRVLALVADAPEARPGDVVRVRAVTASPRATSPSLAWRLCDEQRVSDPRGCAASPDARTLTGSQEVTLPPLDGSWLLVVAACGVGEPTLSRASGRFACGDGEPADEAFRRVRYVATGPLNRAPRIARWSLSCGGTTRPLPATTGESVALPSCGASPCAACDVEVVPADDAAERTPEGALETLSASVYVTVGSTDAPRASSGTGAAPLSVRWRVEGLREGYVWAVLRDLRGGASAVGARVTGSAR